MGTYALLVVDMQKALVEGKPYAIDEVLSTIRRLEEACRQNGVEVIFVQHNDEPGGDLEPNTYGWEICDEIAPISGETCITKDYNSAFCKTDLNEYLKSKGITDLIITGMQTEYCIDTTCKVAFELGYHLIVPRKTNTTFGHEGFPAHDMIWHYNERIWNHRFAKVMDIDEVMNIISKGN